MTKGLEKKKEERILSGSLTINFRFITFECSRDSAALKFPATAIFKAMLDLFSTIILIWIHVAFRFQRELDLVAPADPHDAAHYLYPQLTDLDNGWMESR